MKRITLREVSVSYDTVHEQLRMVEQFLNEEALHTIGTITSRLLTCARNDEIVRKMTEAYDIAVLGEGKLLRGSGIDSAQRIREIRSFDFYEEVLMLLSRRKSTIFLLSDTVERLSAFKSCLGEMHEKMTILGDAALTEHIDDADGIVNEINAAMPDIVLSVISSPEGQAAYTWITSRPAVRPMLRTFTPTVAQAPFTSAPHTSYSNLV